MQLHHPDEKYPAYGQSRKSHPPENPTDVLPKKQKHKARSIKPLSQFEVRYRWRHWALFRSNERKVKRQTGLATFVLSSLVSFSMISLRTPGKCTTQRFPLSVKNQQKWRYWWSVNLIIVPMAVKWSGMSM